MKRTRKWHKKRTIKELKHLKGVGGVTTLKGAKDTFAAQLQQRKDYPGTEPCWTCKSIARKLNLPV